MRKQKMVKTILGCTAPTAQYTVNASGMTVNDCPTTAGVVPIHPSRGCAVLRAKGSKDPAPSVVSTVCSHTKPA
jgi:hypothetical protein